MECAISTSTSQHPSRRRDSWMVSRHSCDPQQMLRPQRHETRDRRWQCRTRMSFRPRRRATSAGRGRVAAKPESKRAMNGFNGRRSPLSRRRSIREASWSKRSEACSCRAIRISNTWSSMAAAPTTRSTSWNDMVRISRTGTADPMPARRMPLRPGSSAQPETSMATSIRTTSCCPGRSSTLPACSSDFGKPVLSTATGWSSTRTAR